jgi:hypothetical protein
MADKRSSKPTQPWKPLRTLAQARGVKTWRGEGASERNQKHEEELFVDLRAYFWINGNPMRFVSGVGWQTEFVVESDAETPDSSRPWRSLGDGVPRGWQWTGPSWGERHVAEGREPFRFSRTPLPYRTVLALRFAHRSVTSPTRTATPFPHRRPVRL